MNAVETPALTRQCDETGCDDIATHVHWLPHVVNCTAVEFACGTHDPGGYWMPFSAFYGADVLKHLAHVANKRASGEALRLFLRKLYPGW